MLERPPNRGHAGSLPTQTLQWVLDATGPSSRIAALRPLPHGGWHANHAVDVVDRSGRTHRLVLRRWARPEWALEDPDLTVEREVTILALLAGTAVPTPGVVAADAEAAVCDVPALLITRLPGAPQRDPRDMRSFLEQLAAVLPAIHAVAGTARNLVPPYRTYVELAGKAPPPWLNESRIWERAFEVASGPSPATGECLIHRDYHPGNTLWSRGRLTGVVDWTQGSWGPPEIDVAWMRWNLACDHGPEAAGAFLAAYREVTAVAEYHPYWDVLAAVDTVAAINPDDRPPREEVRLRLEEHVAAALRRL